MSEKGTPRRRERKKDAGLLTGALSPDLIATGGDESVNVVVRLRPFNRRELEIHQQKNPDEWIRSVIEMPDGVEGTVRVLDRDSTTGEYKPSGENFKFTKSFWSIPEDQQPAKYLPITQEDVFDCIGRVVLINAFAGFNSCVFAYGQTGSGKTYTMMGSFVVENGNFVGEPGIIPRLCRELFNTADAKKKEMEATDPRLKVEFDIKLSAIEIYNEQVRDLFWRNAPVAGRTKNTILKIRVHPTEGAFVDQLTVLNPKNWEQCLKLIAVGMSERTVAATQMNDESSRSHSVFQVTVIQIESQGPPLDDPSRRFEKPVVTTRVSKINLVDLAGSERNKKSGVQGQQLKEAAGINQSLSTLKKVIDALVQNCNERNPKKHIIVPYRESALTQLLSHSLGGNSKTTMIACVSPHYDNSDETLNTLRYANRAKGIINHVKVNEDNAQKQAMLLKQQMEELQRKIAEGPQVYTERELEELRDQIAIGEREMLEKQRKQKLVEEEAARLAAQLKTQKDARMAAAYYNSFKICWLERLRMLSEQMLADLEKKLNVVANERDELTTTLAGYERSSTEARYSVEELKRRGEVWMLKSARNEAMVRELARDIGKTRKRAEDALMARFGSIWLRNSAEHHQLISVEQQKEAMRKDHEQYLQSITREARKQFETLSTSYADRELSHRQRLENAERAASHAQSQLDRAEHLKLSLTLALERSAAEHEKREAAREASWSHRYSEMQRLYEDRLAAMTTRHEKDARKANERLNTAISKAKNDHELKIQELKQKIQQADGEGQFRVDEVVNEARGQVSDVTHSTELDLAQILSALQEHYRTDVSVLRSRISDSQEIVEQKRARLSELAQFAARIDDAAHRVDAALYECDKCASSADYLMYRRYAERFNNAKSSVRFEFHRVSTLLNKSVPVAPSSESL